MSIADKAGSMITVGGNVGDVSNRNVLSGSQTGTLPLTLRGAWSGQHDMWLFRSIASCDNAHKTWIDLDQGISPCPNGVCARTDACLQ